MKAYCKICEKTFDGFLYPEALIHIINEHLELLASFEEYSNIIDLVKKFTNLFPSK